MSDKKSPEEKLAEAPEGEAKPVTPEEKRKEVIDKLMDRRDTLGNEALKTDVEGQRLLGQLDILNAMLGPAEAN